MFRAGKIAVKACHLGQQDSAGSGHGVFKQLEQFGIGDAEHLDWGAEREHVIYVGYGDVARGLPVEREVGADAGAVEESNVGIADALHDVAHPVAHDRGAFAAAADGVFGSVDGDVSDNP